MMAATYLWEGGDAMADDGLTDLICFTNRLSQNLKGSPHNE